MSSGSAAQTFNGETYYKCGFYFQKRGRRLHREVWESYNGAIPKGYHVHHKDGDTSNNDISNLELLHGSEHLSRHMRSRPPVPFTEEARAAAAEWHRSEAGRNWHKEHYEKHGSVMHVRVDRVCECCGKGFVGDLKSKFCSNNCKSKARRLSGVDDVERVCAVCGKAFTINKYQKKRTCSGSCGGVLASVGRKAKRSG